MLKKISKEKTIKNRIRMFVIAIFIFTAIPVYGYVMESSSYRVQSDTVNIGGLRSQSLNYLQESTVGEIATGLSESSNFKLKAGYQQMQEVYLAMTSPGDITMQPSIAGITGGTGNGGTQLVITTDSPAGFALTIKTDSDVGMVGEQHGDYILHLETETPEVPDYDFNSAPANSSAFAYTVNASTTADLVRAFKNLPFNSICNINLGVQTEEKCWIAATTSPRTILNRTSATVTSGATSTIRFRAIISANPSPEIDADVYTATTTLTATSN